MTGETPQPVLMVSPSVPPDMTVLADPDALGRLHREWLLGLRVADEQRLLDIRRLVVITGI